MLWIRLYMNAPARKLKRSAVKNIVRFPPVKANGGKSILVESILESKYCLYLEFDSSVEEYFPQPRTFTVSVGAELRTYTPDFEVRYVSGGRKYVEVKPSERAKHLNRFDGERDQIKATGTYARSSLIQQCLHIEALVAGKQPGCSSPVMLMGLEFREVLSLIHFIAHYQARLLAGSFNPVALSSYELAHLYENVWQTL